MQITSESGLRGETLNVSVAPGARVGRDTLEAPSIELHIVSVELPSDIVSGTVSGIGVFAAPDAGGGLGQATMSMGLPGTCSNTISWAFSVSGTGWAVLL